MRNWAGNVTFSAARVHHPESVDELRRIVAGADRVRALGSGHSFSTVADTTGDLVALDALPPRIEIDADAAEVTLTAGIRYGELAVPLHDAGWALHNMGSLPHISVGGAVSTGTHGSGTRNGCLSTAVTGLEIVTPGGDIVRLRRGDDGFDGAVVGLGSLGIVTALTLRVEPTYDVAQVVYENMPVAEFDLEVFDAGYSVSVFTDWRSDAYNQVWVKRRGAWSAPHRWRGATLANGPRHPIAGISPDACTEQLGTPGPWHTRLPHFRLDFTPSAGAELQTEYQVPIHAGLDALAALSPIRGRFNALVATSELRTIAGDDLWLSPAYGRDSMAIHFTWVDDVDRVAAVIPDIEAALAPFDPRPHWGKVFRAPGIYPRMADFAELRRRHDPDGKLVNAFTAEYVGA